MKQKGLTLIELLVSLLLGVLVSASLLGFFSVFAEVKLQTHQETQRSAEISLLESTHKEILQNVGYLNGMNDLELLSNGYVAKTHERCYYYEEGKNITFSVRTLDCSGLLLKDTVSNPSDIKIEFELKDTCVLDNKEYYKPHINNSGVCLWNIRK